ncbi:regulator of nonsense transcripts UPF3 [Eutrema salsugineum]|uniref:regulator of nonsense transcripts UPF3 n=1 Tax=Eutrema salsugineum TaxID=72664 RepID=UPI000CED49A9|nr:regulator of nonsense transcripts UPF3 [Eutrema salsugineum]
MKDPSPKRKVVVRHLPPSLSQSDLLSQIEPRFGDRYYWFSFRPGKSSYKNQKFSRAYVGFKAPEDVYEFAAFFNGHVFVNEKGAQFKAVVEYAPSQRVPKPCDKKDPREGSISKDPDYLEFLKLIAQPVENLPSAEIQLERREAEQSGAAKPAPIVTPLMEFIRQKRATVTGSQGILDVRRGGRRARAVSANKPSSRPSKRNSEKKKYVEKDTSKSLLRKATSDIGGSKQDIHQPNSSGKDIPATETVNQSAAIASVMDSSLPGIALTMDSGKKKILLLKSKDRDNPGNTPPQPEQQMETNLSGSSSASRQNQKSDLGGRLIKGILQKNELRPSQSSSFVQSEQRVEPSEAENFKRPPRPANTRAGKDYHVSGTNSEKQERRTRNKDRPDRVVWAPLRRGDGSSEDQPSTSAANNGEVKERILLQRSGELVNSSGGHSLENGSARHSSRRVGARNRKEDGFGVTGEGKPSRRGGGGGPNSQEKQMWIQKSSTGT